MKMTFRWYGSDSDSITLKQIKQIPGMSGLMGVLDYKAAGEVWTEEEIKAYVDEVHAAGLECEVIESVNVHEDIKMGLPTRDEYIANYITTIRNLAKYGIKVIVYNFMPVLDWLRTDLKTKAKDGSNSLSYNHAQLLKCDPKNLHLPGWDESYSTQQLNSLLEEYKGISHEKLFENLVYFLNGIMPACDDTGINMAIHPDDPPWDMFGLPRIITGADSYYKMIEAVPDKHNGFTFCTGSLGAGRFNDLPAIAKKYADRIYFAHIRQLKYGGEKDFTEAGHLTSAGDLDIYAIVKALVKAGFDGYVRPDHGRNIWGEDGKPGYGLYDRALGAAYLNGLFEAIEKEK